MTVRDRILDALGELYKKPRHQKQYLSSPQPTLDNEIPNDLIAVGRGDEVLKSLRDFLDDVY